MDSSSHHHEHTTLRLNIKNRGQLRQFLREVQPSFLDVVDPRKSGLLDILYGTHLLTDTDHESLSGKDVNTPKDQARKLWFLLNKMSVCDFLSKVAPVLIKEFPHIIPSKYLTQEMIDVTTLASEDYCLHHDIIGRIRAATMADLLYHHDRLKFEDYEEIAWDGCEASTVWTKMFCCCQGDDDDSSPTPLVPGLRALLEKYRLQVPENLGQLVASGIPCTCNARDCIPPAPSPSPMHKVESWLKKYVWGWHTPTGSESSYSMLELRSCGGTTSLSGGDSRSLSSEDIRTSHGDPTFPAEPGECRGGLTTVDEKGGERSAASEASPLIHKLLEPASDMADETEIYVRKQEAIGRIKKIADDFPLAFGISVRQIKLTSVFVAVLMYLLFDLRFCYFAYRTQVGNC